MEELFSRWENRGVAESRPALWPQSGCPNPEEVAGVWRGKRDGLGGGLEEGRTGGAEVDPATGRAPCLAAEDAGLAVDHRSSVGLLKDDPPGGRGPGLAGQFSVPGIVVDDRSDCISRRDVGVLDFQETDEEGLVVLVEGIFKDRDAGK